jgi:hypothetical protein
MGLETFFAEKLCQFDRPCVCFGVLNVLLFAAPILEEIRFDEAVELPLRSASRNLLKSQLQAASRHKETCCTGSVLSSTAGLSGFGRPLLLWSKHR